MRRNDRALGPLCALTVAFFCLAPAAAGTAQAGEKETYVAKCASCHGKDGKGNGKMAKMFKVEPAALDLSDKGTQGKSDEDLAKLTADGKGKMPAFGSKLGADEISGLVSYIRKLCGSDKTKDCPHKAKASGKGQGHETYLAKCASCHGKDMKGNDKMAKMFKVDAAALNLVDKDTLEKSNEDLAKLTAEGKGKMPAFGKKLSAEEIDAIIACIRKCATKGCPAK